jgi:hypothetical protein
MLTGRARNMPSPKRCQAVKAIKPAVAKKQIWRKLSPREASCTPPNRDTAAGGENASSPTKISSKKAI